MTNLKRQSNAAPVTGRVQWRPSLTERKAATLTQQYAAVCVSVRSVYRPQKLIGWRAAGHTTRRASLAAKAFVIVPGALDLEQQNLAAWNMAAPTLAGWRLNQMPAEIPTTAELRGFRVREHSPGIMGVEIDSGGERVFSMDYNPRTTMALRQLLDAMRLEVKIGAEGIPDLSVWRGAFNIPKATDDAR